MVWSGGAFERAVRRGDAPAPLTALQVEGWQLLRAEWAADADAQAARRQSEGARAAAQPAAAALAEAFLAGRLDAAALREAFDRRTRSDWDAFGLRGPAGAMFLNRLVKRARLAAGGEAALDAALRAALRVPADAESARARLAAFAAQLRADGLSAQPTIATAFATSWWQLQAPAAWPAFRASTRRALAAEEAVFVATGDPAADYGRFRAAVLALAAALDLDPWAFEQLCRWHLRRDAAGAGRGDDAEGGDDAPSPGWPPAAVRRSAASAPAGARGAASRAASHAASRVAEAPGGCFAPAGTVGGAAGGAVDAAPAGAARAGAARPGATPSHTHVQWLLAHLGRRLGCRVWVAANDHRRAWRGEMLGTLSVDRLPPLGLDGDSQRVVELIDVVWLRGASQVAAAFEVERTTSVHAGLLRMADLAALAPNLAVPLYVVAPDARLDKVRRELRRPALRALGLHQRCGFFSAEALVAAAPDIARWASGPRAIDRLAERIAD
jgi:hypothetical protein